MFGYVLPCRRGMSDGEFESYQAFYCGLCKQLHKSYGLFSRFLLNYDLVLLAIVADGQSGEAGQLKCEGCIVNPFRRRQTFFGTRGLSLAADGLVLLSYHKLADNIRDERFAKRLLSLVAKPFMHGMYKKAVKKQPHLGELFALQIARQAQLEREGCACPDEACEPTGLMCAALFACAAANPRQAALLKSIGMYTGQIIYLLDAAEDYEQDAKTGSYNVFIQAGNTKAEADARAARRCRMAAGEIGRACSQLDFGHTKALTNNIFYRGLPASIQRCGIKRAKMKGNQHGQIESL